MCIRSYNNLSARIAGQRSRRYMLGVKRQFYLLPKMPEYRCSIEIFIFLWFLRNDLFAK